MPGKFEAAPDTCIQMMGIEVDIPILRQLLDAEKMVCPDLMRSLKTGSSAPFFTSGKMQVMQSVAVRQIFSYPFGGQAGCLFLQSKVLELISLQIHFLTRQEPPIQRTVLSADDEERIRYARELLKSRMIDAPNLIELSQLIGLSTSKLKKGFKIVFGKTAFACLHEDRMERACNLLAENRMNVSQVAWEVGYINVGHFSTAFRRHFGIRPKDFQLYST